MQGTREPACEAGARPDASSANLSLALAPLTSRSRQLAPRRDARSPAMASTRPHDPPYLHSFSLLI
jgi:hypothetical protein